MKPKRKKPGTAIKRKVQPIAVDAKGKKSPTKATTTNEPKRKRVYKRTMSVQNIDQVSNVCTQAFLSLFNQANPFSPLYWGVSQFTVLAR